MQRIEERVHSNAIIVYLPDWISVVLWVVIFAFGLCFQRKCKCIDNRPHNPMPRIFRDPEQRPLIARLTSSGDSNDVFLSPRSNSAFLNSLSQRGNRWTNCGFLPDNKDWNADDFLILFKQNWFVIFCILYILSNHHAHLMICIHLVAHQEFTHVI